LFNADAPVASEIFEADDILEMYVGGTKSEIPYFTQSALPKAVRSTVSEDNGVEAPLKVMRAAFSGRPIKKVVATKAMARACVFFIFFLVCFGLIGIEMHHFSPVWSRYQSGNISPVEYAVSAFYFR
jgi:pilus assembly protein TadC